MSETDFSAHIPGAAAPKPVIPRFRTEAVQMMHRSQQEGHPVFEDREFVDMIIPGDRRSMASEPVNEEHKARWPKEYAAFKAGQELPLDGTPLANWPNSQMTKARVEELVYFNIRTVEELAAVNDAQLQNLGMGARQMRESARKFLEVARTGTAPLERLVAENLRLRDEVERLTRDLTEANARANAAEKTHAGA